MTTTRPRPPAMTGGRYWHVRSYLRAVGRIGFLMLLTQQLFAVGAHIDFYRATGFVHIFYRDSAERLLEQHPLWAEAVYQGPIRSLPEILTSYLSYELILAVIVGGLVCTVALEIRERERRREQ